MISSLEIIHFYTPRSNMHARKRSFTEKNGDIRRSCTASVYDARIRSDTVRNGFRKRRSYKNMEWLKDKHLYSVYGVIRLPYTVVYHRTRSYLVVYDYHKRTIQWTTHFLQLTYIFRRKIGSISLDARFSGSSFLPSFITGLSSSGRRLKSAGHKFCHSDHHITSIRLLSHDSLAMEKGAERC